MKSFLHVSQPKCSPCNYIVFYGLFDTVLNMLNASHTHTTITNILAYAKLKRKKWFNIFVTQLLSFICLGYTRVFYAVFDTGLNMFKSVTHVYDQKFKFILLKTELMFDFANFPQNYIKIVAQ